MNHLDRIAAAEKRAKEAKRALLMARRAASSQQRKNLTRAKIILGGAVIAAGPELVEKCLQLANDRDRTHVLAVLRPPAAKPPERTPEPPASTEPPQT